MILLTSAGLFVLTAALCQWIQPSSGKRERHRSTRSRRYKGRVDGDQSSFTDDDDDESVQAKLREYQSLRAWYKDRRLYDRLSYENLAKEGSLSSSTGAFPMFSAKGISAGGASRIMTIDDEGSSSSASENDDDTQRRFLPLTSRRDSEMHPHEAHDFYPKNRNWRHFEHFNERDRQYKQSQLRLLQRQATDAFSIGCDDATNSSTVPNHQEPLMSSPIPERESSISAIQSNQQKHPIGLSLSTDDQDIVVENDAPDDSDDCEDDAQSISSHGSGSSEEQFVWTGHQHRRSKTPDTPSWSQTLRDTVVRTSTRLFETGEEGGRTTEDSSQAAERTANRTSDEVKNLFPTISKSTPTNSRKVNAKSSPQSIIDDETQHQTNVKGSAKAATTITTQHNKHRNLRAQYNARIMPDKLVMIRHGQSLGNSKFKGHIVLHALQAAASISHGTYDTIPFCTNFSRQSQRSRIFEDTR